MVLTCNCVVRVVCRGAVVFKLLGVVDVAIIVISIIILYVCVVMMCCGFHSGFVL